jgi:uncharacterized membrane protein
MFDVGSLILLGGAVALTVASYDALPARIPTHFGLSGQANDWTRRDVGAWLGPAIGLVTWAVVRFTAAWAPGAWRTRAAQSPMPAIGFLTAAVMAGAQAMILWGSFHPGESIGRALAFGLAALQIAFAFVMPRTRRNPVIGIRVAWTLASDENWARTHRLAGQSYAVSGVVALLGALVGGSAAAPIAVVALLAGSLVPTVYSYVIARGEA